MPDYNRKFVEALKRQGSPAFIVFAVEDRTQRIYAWMNERIKAFELISHCEGCNDEAISGLTNESGDCHSPAGFAVTYFDMPSCDNEVVNSCVKHV